MHKTQTPEISQSNHIIKKKTKMVDDTVLRSRSLGVGASGVPDQYADGAAAKVWEIYIGGYSKRTEAYKEFLLRYLKDHKVKNILDVACGTGVDSIMLLDNGFRVSSIDASDKMLKYALRVRWDRRNEEGFNNWDIEEGNWLTLSDTDIKKPGKGFDAVVCLGNSFAHLPDPDGDFRNQRAAIGNFHKMLKPGGILIIDHRNYDFILDTGKAPQRNIYYNSERIVDIKTNVLSTNGIPRMITLDYVIDGTPAKSKQNHLNGNGHTPEKQLSTFRLSYCPLRLNAFNAVLGDVFGEDSKHTVLGDFRPLGEVQDPAYYVHIIQRKN